MYKSRLREKYRESIRGHLKQRLSLKSDMMIPQLEKIVVTSTSKDFVSNSKLVDDVYQQIFDITGQKPVITKAKKSIAGFKLREGMPIGVKVTLRNDAMYDFLDRLVEIALPRTRDFNGFRNNQFDGNGNFAIGIKEQIIFPEIDYDKIDRVRGMNIIFVTSTNNDSHAIELLKQFNIPFNN